jgi:type I restriction enzyme M protein
MKDIEETNPSLKGALSSRDKDGNPNYTFFATLGASNTKIKDLIDNVNQIDEKRFQEEDLIGRVYEYFLRKFCIAAKSEKGEFFTPGNIVELM